MEHILLYKQIHKLHTHIRTCVSIWVASYTNIQDVTESVKTGLTCTSNYTHSMNLSCDNTKFSSFIRSPNIRSKESVGEGRVLDE